MKIRIKIINGANLNMLGRREPIYGTRSLAEICDEIAAYALENGAEPLFFQSNSEGAIINEIHSCAEGFAGIVINPGAYAHYSYAIADALTCVNAHKIEVHLTDITKRESFRASSVTAVSCDEMISGLGVEGYKRAVNNIIKKFKQL